MRATVALLLLVASCLSRESLAAAELPDQAARPQRSGPRPTAFLDASQLDALPHVHKITITPASKQPTRQIIHLLDWHFVHREDFAAEIQSQAEKAEKGLSDAEIDREWESSLKSKPSRLSRRLCSKSW